MSFSLENMLYLLPQTCVSNSELAKEFGVKEDYIFRKTGIRKRYVLLDEEHPSDLAKQAIDGFFKNSSNKKEEVDFLIFCSEGFDYIAGTTSAILQHECGFSKKTGAIDLPHGCTGYIYGLMLAKSLLMSEMAKCVLFVTADFATKTLHPESLELRSIFSDAASVTLLRKEDINTIGNFSVGTDGGGAHLLYIKGSGAKNPIDANWFEEHKDFRGGMPWGKMVMDGMEIFLFAMREVPGLIQETLKKNNLNPEDIDLYIFHQANGFLLEKLRQKINIPKEKYFTYLENVGNTVSATLPICLIEALKQNKIKKGNKVLLAGFGIGLSWAATVIEI